MIFLPGITIREGDSFEAALKKFKKQVEKAGTLSEVRKREHYEKPSVKRKKKAAAAKKRALKKTFPMRTGGGGGRNNRYQPPEY